MKRVLLAGLGGAMGSMLRYTLAGVVQRAARDSAFPWGTLAVNLIGCLLIGFLATLADERGVLTTEARVLLMVGVLGGFTTFSTFGLETFELLRVSQWTMAAANVGGSVLFGLFAVWLGTVLGRIV